MMSRRHFTSLAATIAKRNSPTLIMMEGGYAVDELRANVAALCRGSTEPYPIGSTVVDLISDSATVELTSCTPGSCESWLKKKRS